MFIVYLYTPTFNKSFIFYSLFLFYCVLLYCNVLCMAIPIITCIESCYDKFDVMSTPFSALEVIIGRYINYRLLLCILLFLLIRSLLKRHFVKTKHIEMIRNIDKFVVSPGIYINLHIDFFLKKYRREELLHCYVL